MPKQVCNLHSLLIAFIDITITIWRDGEPARFRLADANRGAKLRWVRSVLARKLRAAGWPNGNSENRRMEGSIRFRAVQDPPSEVEDTPLKLEASERTEAEKRAEQERESYNSVRTATETVQPQKRGAVQ